MLQTIQHLCDVDLVKRFVLLNTKNAAKYPPAASAWRNAAAASNYYFDESDTTAPTAGSEEGILLPFGCTFSVLQIALGTRETWGIAVWLQVAATGVWSCVGANENDAVSMATASKVRTITVSADTILPFHFAGHYSRMLVQHKAVSGATTATKCRAYVLGSGIGD